MSSCQIVCQFKFFTRNLTQISNQRYVLHTEEILMTVIIIIIGGYLLHLFYYITQYHQKANKFKKRI